MARVISNIEDSRYWLWLCFSVFFLPWEKHEVKAEANAWSHLIEFVNKYCSTFVNFYAFRFWLGGAAPETSRFLVGGGKAPLPDPPLTGLAGGPRIFLFPL